MDLQHESFLLMLDGALHRAPIGPSPRRILDIGTGSGMWSIDMARLYPAAEVVGTDVKYSLPFSPVFGIYTDPQQSHSGYMVSPLPHPSHTL